MIRRALRRVSVCSVQEFSGCPVFLEDFLKNCYQEFRLRFSIIQTSSLPRSRTAVELWSLFPCKYKALAHFNACLTTSVEAVDNSAVAAGMSMAGCRHDTLLEHKQAAVSEWRTGVFAHRGGVSVAAGERPSRLPLSAWPPR